MIRVTPMVESADRFTVVVRFLLQDFSGSGIRTITLYDNFSVEIPVGQPVGCITTYEFVTEPINRRRLPLHIEATDCAGELTSREATGPIFYPGKKSGPGVPMPCSAVDCADDPDCSRAVRIMNETRTDLRALCTQCRQLRDDAKAQLRASIGYTAGFVAALGIAIASSYFFFDFWIQAFFYALAASFMIAAINAIIEKKSLREEAEQCERERNTARELFIEAVARTNEYCCPGCIFGDTSMPC